MLLSVVIPNYNHSKLLERAFYSILYSSLVPNEIIIVDDCSTDDSWNLITKLRSENLERVSAYRNAVNLGVTETINRGLSFAQGEYFYSAAADDFVHPMFFKKVITLLKKYPQCPIGCCAGKWTEGNLSWRVGHNMTKEDRYFIPEEVYNLELKGKLFIPGHAAIVRTQMLNGSLNAKHKFASDWFTFNRLAFNHGLCVVPETLATFNISPNTYYKRIQKDKKATEEVFDNLVYYSTGRMISSGALYIWGFPMLRYLIKIKRFYCINFPYLRKLLKHEFKRRGKNLWLKITQGI